MFWLKVIFWAHCGDWSWTFWESRLSVSWWKSSVSHNAGTDSRKPQLDNSRVCAVSSNAQLHFQTNPVWRSTTAPEWNSQTDKECCTQGLKTYQWEGQEGFSVSIKILIHRSQIKSAKSWSESEAKFRHILRNFPLAPWRLHPQGSSSDLFLWGCSGAGLSHPTPAGSLRQGPSLSLCPLPSYKLCLCFIRVMRHFVARESTEVFSKLYIAQI